MKITLYITHSFHPVSKKLFRLDRLTVTVMDLVLCLIELKLLTFFKNLLRHYFSVIYLYFLTFLIEINT